MLVHKVATCGWYSLGIVPNWQQERAWLLNDTRTQQVAMDLPSLDREKPPKQLKPLLGGWFYSLWLNTSHISWWIYYVNTNCTRSCGVCKIFKSPMSEVGWGTNIILVLEDNPTEADAEGGIRRGGFCSKSPRKCSQTGSDRCSIASYLWLGLLRQMETENMYRAEGYLWQSWRGSVRLENQTHINHSMF